MEQRISMVTLGARDLDRAVAFYEALGWTRFESPADVAFFQAGGMILGLWERGKLAEDSGAADDGEGFDGVVLAQNVGSPAAVDVVIEEARSHGATITVEPRETFWGGYSGVFRDPDGHCWEVAHNPFWTITEDGRTLLEAEA